MNRPWPSGWSWNIVRSLGVVYPSLYSGGGVAVEDPDTDRRTPLAFFLKGWKLGSTGAHLFQTDKRYRYFLPFSLAHQNIGEFENWTFLNSALTGPKSYILPDGVFESGARQQKIRQTQQRWKSIALFWPHCHLQVRYYGYYLEEAAYQPVFSAGDVVLYQHFG